MTHPCCVHVAISKSNCHGNYKENKARVSITIIYNPSILCEGAIMPNVYAKRFKDTIQNLTDLMLDWL